MARIVKLAEILPEDIAFEMPGGQRFLFPGDPPLDLILKIASLYERAENADEESAQVGIDVLQELDNELVALLRMRDDTITSSPFGVVAVQHVVAELLTAYNFGEAAEDVNPPNRAARRSTRSNGSPSSAKSSASQRRTGMS